MSNLVILYHGSGCPDGHTAAWAAWLKHPDAEFISIKHGECYPEGLEGKDVVMLDFCYSKEEMLEINSIANSLLCLDHHITAYNDCKDLDFCHFDMELSGAGLAWNHFHPGRETPWIIEYIQYRDLGYLWTRPKSEHPHMLEKVLAAVDSYEQTFEQWSHFHQSANLDHLQTQGEAILRYKRQLIKIISKNAQEITIRGKKALSVNTPVFQSEVGNFLTRQVGAELGVCWYQRREGTKFSLRSTDEKADVSKIAKSFYKGGGHRNAAGFNSDDVNLAKLVGGNEDDSNNS